MIRLSPKEKSKGLKRTPLKRKPPKVRTAKPKLLRTWAKTPPKKIAFLTKAPPKKRKGLAIRIDPLDQLFSLYIRTRDNFTCQRCGVKSKNVQCAHFIGNDDANGAGLIARSFKYSCAGSMRRGVSNLCETLTWYMSPFFIYRLAFFMFLK